MYPNRKVFLYSQTTSSADAVYLHVTFRSAWRCTWGKKQCSGLQVRLNRRPSPWASWSLLGWLNLHYNYCSFASWVSAGYRDLTASNFWRATTGCRGTEDKRRIGSYIVGRRCGSIYQNRTIDWWFGNNVEPIIEEKRLLRGLDTLIYVNTHNRLAEKAKYALRPCSSDLSMSLSKSICVVVGGCVDHIILLYIYRL